MCAQRKETDGEGHKEPQKNACDSLQLIHYIQEWLRVHVCVDFRSSLNCVCVFHVLNSTWLSEAPGVAAE